MNKLVYLENADFESYNPLFTFNEDLSLDNRFCILNTNAGNIAFSYYDLEVHPSVVIHNNILFICFGVSYYVVNLNEKKIRYQSQDTGAIIFEIIKCESRECVVFVGELVLLCFSFTGKMMWKNQYRNVIFDWIISDEQLSIFFENEDKWAISFDNGEGIPIQ